MKQRQTQRQTVIVNVAPKRKKRTTRKRAPARPVRQHIMPPPVIQVVQERWFQPPPTQAPQQFHYEKPNLPRREMATQWESMTAPVQNDLGQVVGDLMQKGIEPTEMQGLSARDLASIRDALTSEKVAVDTQTEEPPSSNTIGVQVGRRLPRPQELPSIEEEPSTFKSTSTFGGQTEPPSQTTFASQTDTPGFNTIGTQLGRTPVKKPIPLLPPVPKVPQVPPKRVPTLSSSDTISLLDIPPKPYEDMSTEELKVAVQYKGVQGAQNLNKTQLQAVLQSDNPATTAAVLVKGKGKKPAVASPADSAFEAAVKKPPKALYTPPGARPTSSRIVSLD